LRFSVEGFSSKFLSGSDLLITLDLFFQVYLSVGMPQLVTPPSSEDEGCDDLDDFPNLL